MFNRRTFKKKPNQPNEKNEELNNVSEVRDLFNTLSSSNDFINHQGTYNGVGYWVSFYRSLIDAQVLHESVLSVIPTLETINLEQIKENVPIENTLITSTKVVIEDRIMRGEIALRLDGNLDECLLINVAAQQGRQVNKPELEFGIISAQEAFVEDIDINLNLVRKRLPVPGLQVSEMTVGSLSKTKVAILSIEGIVDQENVDNVIQRINDVEFDEILDGSYLAQMLYDNSNTLFPLFLNTERPDRIASALAEGKVALLIDRSSSALITPTILLEYFNTMEDYNMPWVPASAFRLLRIFAVAFSIFATPIYVAVLTYHYELIPKDLLETIVTSRNLIPFQPLIEALFLEISIELLREAAARLPTKVGQTLGIVGGIVIGQAAVVAGLTSNILLIIVALSALASFVTPIYKMGNAIRLLRFPFLVGAQIWGLLGITIAAVFLMTHLIKLTSMGHPYLEPIYPFRMQDWKDSFVRLPFNLFKSRPVNLRPDDTSRQPQPKKARIKKNDFNE
ncbi:spore germination protein [Peribacillus frigoritolerans]|uniref:spore germination protein n=1 Tax=Peribacillus frigoritolerans TaxID=450367 RepID=UPI0024C198C1|nr:spore germination protein [Peribacillus frigoritolerans]WHX69214.1 spore germination protein [Peribacillus frigoritolerans]